MGHALITNRHGLVVYSDATEANGMAKRHDGASGLHGEPTKAQARGGLRLGKTNHQLAKVKERGMTRIRFSFNGGLHQTHSRKFRTASRPRCHRNRVARKLSVI